MSEPPVVQATIVSAEPSPTQHISPTRIVPAGATNAPAPPPRQQRRKSMRRSGTLALQRMQTQSAVVAPEGGHHHHHRRTVDGSAVSGLTRVKASGIASTRTVAGMAAFKKANLLDDPSSVVHQTIAVQRSFRMKIMLSFVAQSATLLAVAIACMFTPRIRQIVDQNFSGPQSRVLALVVSMVVLLVIFFIKYKPPYSQIAMIMWTVLFGGTVAVMQAQAPSYAMLQIIAYICLSMLLNSVFAQRTVRRQLEEGGPKEQVLVSPVMTGLLAWLIVFLGGVALQASPYRLGTWGHWFSANFIAFIATMWVCYDTELLGYKMEPSEWSQAIVFYVTDLALLAAFGCLICICCCLGGDGAGEAADAGSAGAESAASAGGDVATLA